MSNLGNKKIFSENLKRYMNLYQKTRADICKDLNFAYTTFVSWETGVNYPRIDKIEKIANYFGIEKSDLIEKKTAPNDAHASLPDLTQKDEREIESDLEDMMNSISSAAYEGDDGIEDMEAFKATIKAAMIQAKRIAKKKYTPKKYRKDK